MSMYMKFRTVINKSFYRLNIIDYECGVPVSA